MTHRLKLFGVPEDAERAAARSRAGNDLQRLVLDGKTYLKKPGSDGIEPRYLCEDGRWRRYDAIVDLPHSTAQTRLEEALTGRSEAV